MNGLTKPDQRAFPFTNEKLRQKISVCESGIATKTWNQDSDPKSLTSEIMDLIIIFLLELAKKVPFLEASMGGTHFNGQRRTICHENITLCFRIDCQDLKKMP